MSKKPRISQELLYFAPSVPALIAVLWLLRAGYSPQRWWPVAGFLAIWAGSSGYVLFVKYATAQRAFRLSAAEVPVGVYLPTPLWITATEGASGLPIGAGLAAIAAALGFPGVGTGLLLALGAIPLLTLLVPTRVAGLTLEPRGLRVHHRKGAHFFVPWTAVAEVGVSGPSHNLSTTLRIAAAQHVLASTFPDTPRTRTWVQFLLQAGSVSDADLALPPWTAGLDAPTLARALRERLGDRPSLAN